MLLTPMANEKNFNQKNFNNVIGTPFDSRVNIYINFCLQVHFKVYLGICNLILFPLFATGVIDTSGKFASSVVDTGGNFYTGGKFATGIVDNGGKLAACINNTSETGGKICRQCR
jgi:hypothetical protein